MSTPTYDQHEPNSIPKLALFKLPCKLRERALMLTPPLHPSASVPFLWEETPGKPRGKAPPQHRPKVARCLELSPRLLSDVKITEMTSPTTVLDGPYVDRSLSFSCTLSFRKEPLPGREVRPKRKGDRKRFGSGRWGVGFREEKFDGRDSSGFSTTLDDLLRSEKNASITGVRKKKNFFCLSSISSNFWADIYASFKQAVPWKRT